MKYLLMTTLVFMFGCEDTMVTAHRMAKTGGKVCYHAAKPVDIAGKYCLEFIK